MTSHVGLNYGDGVADVDEDLQLTIKEYNFSSPRALPNNCCVPKLCLFSMSNVIHVVVVNGMRIGCRCCWNGEQQYKRSWFHSCSSEDFAFFHCFKILSSKFEGGDLFQLHGDLRTLLCGWRTFLWSISMRQLRTSQ